MTITDNHGANRATKPKTGFSNAFCNSVANRPSGPMKIVWFGSFLPHHTHCHTALYIHRYNTHTYTHIQPCCLSLVEGWGGWRVIRHLFVTFTVHYVDPNVTCMPQLPLFSVPDRRHSASNMGAGTLLQHSPSFAWPFTLAFLAAGRKKKKNLGEPALLTD